MEALVLAAPMQLRSIEAILPATVWHTEHSDNLTKLHGLLTKVNNEAVRIKTIVATLALVEVFANSIRHESRQVAVKEQESCILYVKSKLGLKDFGVFGAALRSQIGGLKGGPLAPGDAAVSSESATTASSSECGRALKRHRKR